MSEHYFTEEQLDALEIVLNLASQNTLDECECEDSFELKEQAKIQYDAIEIVETIYQDGLSQGDF